MILFINTCVRKGSRTKRLADRYLSKTKEEIIEIRPAEIDFPKVDEDFLTKRDRLISEERYDDPMFDLANQFAQADEIVIAEPYWDLSFPASLKQYFEQINVSGITFRYSPEGIPVGLCRAKKLIYITTGGGPDLETDFGYGYAKALARDYYGIRDVLLIKAEGLDIWGADVEQIMKAAEQKIDSNDF